MSSLSDKKVESGSEEIVAKSSATQSPSPTVSATPQVTIDIETLKYITNYANWIPITQGLHEEFFTEHFPGWDWNDFVPRLIDKGILKFNELDNPEFTKLSQGLFISSDVQAIEFIPQKNGVRVKVQLKS